VEIDDPDKIIEGATWNEGLAGCFAVRPTAWERQ
jgi:hypothetical protein